MKLTFMGAAGEVTGSCLRVDHGGLAFLVDCGLFQGGRVAELRNREALDFDVREIDFVLLTHAHLDHSGLVPRLVMLGYKGPVYATSATVDLLGILLLDSGHIQEKEAEWALRHARHHRRWRSARLTPLYTVEQARASLSSLRAVSYDRFFRPAAGVRCRFRDAGHILGSAILEIDLLCGDDWRRLVVSGDLGQPMRPVVRDPVRIERADVLCVESTYGNRAHRSLEATYDELVDVIETTVIRHQAKAVIPAFAVGRTQEILFVLADLIRGGRLPALRVVVDSPMAAAVTALTVRHRELWDEETRALQAWWRANPRRLDVRFVHDVEESIALNSARGGMVIISASGMCEGGRIRHHLFHNLGCSECAVIFTGFQAAGTLGRRLVDGARQVTLFGERVAVNASIHTIGGLSAHADQPALLDWLRAFRREPEHVFVVHGEKSNSLALAEAVEEKLGWSRPVLPERGRTYSI